ncbi:MAG: DUF1501 domain-containing protein [Planctomycetota bacterium]|nr:MAG: DUF1501 domain-containing protein [Planctomycetota bacterium]
MERQTPLSSPTPVDDIHATILHQLGLDHTRLTMKSHGIDRRLTDVHGGVIENWWGDICRLFLRKRAAGFRGVKDNRG